MLFQIVHAVVMIFFRAILLDNFVHHFHLPIRPRMLEFGQLVADPLCLTDSVKRMDFVFQGHKHIVQREFCHPAEFANNLLFGFGQNCRARMGRATLFIFNPSISRVTLTQRI